MFLRLKQPPHATPSLSGSHPIPMPLPIPAHTWEPTKPTPQTLSRPSWIRLLCGHFTEVCLLLLTSLVCTQSPSNPALVGLVACAVFCVYFNVCLRIFGIQITSHTGARASFFQRTARTAYAILSLSSMGIGYWWCLLNPQQQTWHDVLARTVPLQRTQPYFTHWRQRPRKI